MPDFIGAVTGVSPKPKGERPLKREFPPGFCIDPSKYRKPARTRNSRKGK
jgi:hypothetical protein